MLEGSLLHAPVPTHAHILTYPPQHTYTLTLSHMHMQVVQGQPIRSQVFVELKPPNYVIMSVITMLFFCFIFGLIALLLSLQVGGGRRGVVGDGGEGEGDTGWWRGGGGYRLVGRQRLGL